ncbi:MAG: hypothetical protein GKR89_22045 [Candidatus Latescibacteria bacterium]|nr:hypothetical protein [Candidatus Latescibacterota bacterium]
MRPVSALSFNHAIYFRKRQGAGAQDTGWYFLSQSLTGPTGGHQRSADAFVDGQLIPCTIGDCGSFAGDTAVRADSWARIKVSFR